MSSSEDSRSPNLGLAALLLANLGVGLLSVVSGWGYYETLLIYWLEALVVGGFNVLRLLVVGILGERPLGTWLANNIEATMGARVFFTLLGAGFFVVKFGGLALAVGIFVIALPAFFSGPGESGVASVFEGLRAAGAGVGIGVALLVASHGFSFVRNFLGKREYARLSVLELVFLPYARMFLVAVVLAVGLLVARLMPGAGATTAFAVVMVLLKTAADAGSHLSERRWLAERSPN